MWRSGLARLGLALAPAVLVVVLSFSRCPSVVPGQQESSVLSASGPPDEVLRPESVAQVAAGYEFWTPEEPDRFLSPRQLPATGDRVLLYRCGLLKTRCTLVYVSAEGTVLRVYHGGT